MHNVNNMHNMNNYNSVHEQNIIIITYNVLIWSSPLWQYRANLIPLRKPLTGLSKSWLLYLALIFMSSVLQVAFAKKRQSQVHCTYYLIMYLPKLHSGRWVVIFPAWRLWWIIRHWMDQPKSSLLVIGNNAFCVPWLEQDTDGTVTVAAF